MSYTLGTQHSIFEVQIGHTHSNLRIHIGYKSYYLMGTHWVHSIVSLRYTLGIQNSIFEVWIEYIA